MKKEKRIVGICPSCGKKVTQRDSVYACTDFACDFVVAKTALASVGHPTLKSSEMKALLRGPVRLSFQKADGTRRLYLVELKKSEGQWRPWIDFDTPALAPSMGPCPKCGADVAEYPLSFGCTRWEEGCDFAVFKNKLKRFGGKMLDEKSIRQLLKEGRVRVTILDFDRKPRQVTLYLDEEDACQIDFKDEKNDRD